VKIVNGTIYTYIPSISFQVPKYSRFSTRSIFALGTTSRGIKLPWDFTVLPIRDPAFTGLDGVVCTGSGHHGIPRDEMQPRPDSTGLFCGIRPPLGSSGGMQPRRDSTGFFLVPHVVLYVLVSTRSAPHGYY